MGRIKLFRLKGYFYNFVKWKDKFVSIVNVRINWIKYEIVICTL